MMLFIWCLYLLFFPIQIFPQGYFQIADYLIVIGLFYNIFKNNFILKSDRYFNLLSVFAFYTFFVGLIFTAVYANLEFIKTPLNYLYCLAFAYYISSIYEERYFLKATLIALLFSNILQIILFYKIGINFEQARVTILFANPNQLGFWGVNVIAISLILYHYMKKKNIFLLTILILTSFFLVNLSLSQAAILSITITIFILIFKFASKKPLAFLMILIGLLISGTLIKSILNNTIYYQNLENRIENDLLSDDDDGDNSLEARNYTRLIHFPQYLIFGSGEGQNERFGMKDLNEIHSSFANIIFSYGIIGFAVLLSCYLLIYTQKNWFVMFVLFAYFGFTLTHNTVRWALFWGVPYLAYLLANKKNNTEYVRN